MLSTKERERFFSFLKQAAGIEYRIPDQEKINKSLPLRKAQIGEFRVRWGERIVDSQLTPSKQVSVSDAKDREILCIGGVPFCPAGLTYLNGAQCYFLLCH